MGGLDKNGYSIKRLDEILSDLTVAQKTVFGADLVLDASSPDAQLNGLLAEQIAILWELGLDVWSSLDPRTATGVQLDRLASIVGVARNQSSPTTLFCDLNGTPNQLISSGLVVSAPLIPSTTFLLVSDVTLDGNGFASAQFVANDNGAIIVAPNTVTVIDTLVSGLDTVNNPLAGDTGTNIETDEELRLRRDLSTSTISTSTIASIYNAIVSVAGVTHLKVFENTTDAVVDTITPHAFYAVVKGGLNEDVAKQIALNRPVGTGMFGSLSIPWTDSVGFVHQIFMDRPTEIPIYIKINVNETDDWTNSSSDDIKNALVAYLDGTSVACDEFAGYTIGDDVFASDMYAPISNLGGFKITSILVGTVYPATDTLVVIDLYDLATFDVANIEVINV